ncbi:MAG TPA: DUF547 domain-containing protein [bacterium]|nr:DUF547 domain-containing protein [bacterium]
MNGQGLVDYPSLKKNRVSLDRFLETVGEVAPEDFQHWDKPDQIAFYINSYNAYTLQTIIDHYPIVKHGLFSDGGPGGIKDIAGAWNSLSHRVLGQEMTLDHIEHDILRKQYREPRIHLALVCASKGCPWLAREPYNGSKLDFQLACQASLFFTRQDSFKIDRTFKKIRLSSLFKWYGNDFISSYYSPDLFPGFSEKENAVLNFSIGFKKAAKRQFSQSIQGYGVEYMDYDWSLNVQAPRE